MNRLSDPQDLAVVGRAPRPKGASGRRAHSGLSETSSSAKRPGRPPGRTRHAAISLGQALNGSEGWRYAISRLNAPPTLFVSITWSEAPSSRWPHALDRLKRIRDRMKAWLRHRAPSTAYVWIESREQPPGKSEGAHLAVHVPDQLKASFALMMARWVAQDADHVGPKAVDVRDVGSRWWDRYAYMIKGGDADVQNRFDTTRFKKTAQGVIDGPRLRISKSIGPTARKAAGFVCQGEDVADAAEVKKWMAGAIKAVVAATGPTEARTAA